MSAHKTILAVPKGRILKELLPILERADIHPENDFSDSNSRKLKFTTNHKNLDIIRVRSFDAATFVAYGGAHLGIVGSDVLAEYNYDGLYAPLDLDIGHCRLALAAPKTDIDSIKLDTASHIRVATKYPYITEKYFSERGIQAECIKLNGAMEIAPALGLSKIIVDLVSTGSTLKANALEEMDTILSVSSKLVVARTAQKTMPKDISVWINRFRDALQNTVNKTL